MGSPSGSDFQFLAENSADIICRFGMDRRLHYVSPSSVHILGWTPDEMIAMEPFALVVPEDIPVIVEAINRDLVKGAVSTPVMARNYKKDGTVVWLEATARLVRDPNTDEPIETVLSLRDITLRKHLEDQLARMALTDGLTGLANRRCFDDTLVREWARTLRNGSKTSLLLLDVDHFKQFNDRYGHQVGDDCLRAIAHAVHSCITRSSDLVARYGGEELAVILSDTDAAGAVAAAERIRQAVVSLAIPHQDNLAGSGYVSASIGVATALAHHGGSMQMPESLLMSADHALYKAKHKGRNRVAATILMASRTA